MVVSATAVAPAFPATAAAPLWYAAYTCSRHEKRVAEQLARRDVEHFLPLYHTVSRWKDRRVEVHLPLFPGYVFVRIPIGERVRVLEVPSVVRLVGFNGVPAALADEEITSLREGLGGALRGVQPHPYLKVGRRVRVVRGALAGREGVLIRKKDKLRLVISIDLIMRSMSAEIDAADVEPIR